jgi:hypothetical protein
MTVRALWSPLMGTGATPLRKKNLQPKMVPPATFRL